MACEITYNNFEISLVVFYAKYHNKSCYYLYKELPCNSCEETHNSFSIVGWK